MKRLLFLFTIFVTSKCLNISDPFPSCLKANVTYNPSNLISLHPGFPSPEECQLFCRDTNECNVFTWVPGSATVFPFSCLLYSSEDLSTDSDCTDCVSGPQNCLCTQQGECRQQDGNILQVICLNVYFFSQHYFSSTKR